MPWSDFQIEAGQVLELGEIGAVVDALRRRINRDPRRRFRMGLRDLVVFRLSACCGLRAGEIAGLRLPRVRDGIDRPYLLVVEGAKLDKTRTVPLYLDAGTLFDLRRWLEYRRGLELGHDRVIVRVVGERFGEPVDRFAVRAAFKRAVGAALEPDRVATITTHTGRHTFASHAVRRYPLPNVQAWIGHYNVAMTSRYLHVLELAERTRGDLFAPQENGGAVSGAAVAPTIPTE